MPARKPPYLLRIAAKNYRSLHDVDVRLGPLNVLVGPNGAGKSTLIDVLAFLGDAARRDLSPALTQRGGFDEMVFRGQERHPWIEIRAEVATGSKSGSPEPSIYTLRFRPHSYRTGKDGHQLLSRVEDITFSHPEGGARVTLSGTVLETVIPGRPVGQLSLFEETLALATLPKLVTQEGGVEMGEVADLLESFRLFDVDVAAARRPEKKTFFTSRLKSNAENLGFYLQYLSEKRPAAFEQVQQDARHFVPGLEEIVFRPTSGAVEGLVTQINERGLSGPTDLGEVSFGSIRALALLALLHDPKPAKITCLEEVDHGLHPYVLDRLVDLMREASTRTQLIVATHSPALVNRLNADELIVCERDATGASQIPAISSADVRAMEETLHGELALGELWFTGALGGVPQE